MDRKSNKSKPVREVNALWPIMLQAAGLPDDQAALQRVKASMRRMVDARRQMERRAGPLYELAVYRSGVISDAYRAAGSRPARVVPSSASLQRARSSTDRRIKIVPSFRPGVPGVGKRNSSTANMACSAGSRGK